MQKKLPYLLGVVVLCCVILMLFAFLFGFLFGNPLVAWHNHQLKAALQDLPEGTVTLEEAVPFAWDMVYSFDPYTSRAEMERVMHLKSASVREGVSEEQRSIVFTKGNKVVCSVCNPTGYDIWGLPVYTVYGDSSDQSRRRQCSFLQYGTNASFAVSHENGTVRLRYRGQQAITEDKSAAMQIFEYQNLRLGITNVCEMRTETWIDDMGDRQELPVYVCAFGAKIIVLQADMVDGAECEDGLLHGQWKIYQSAADYSWEEQIEILDDMEPFMVTENTKGIGAEGVYVLRFEIAQE